jgi:hypothetical protein
MPSRMERKFVASFAGTDRPHAAQAIDALGGADCSVMLQTVWAKHDSIGTGRRQPVEVTRQALRRAP